MKIIETERWVPSKEDPSRSEYIGQRTGQEVFEELRQQLENMGCLPDEYFLLDQQWEKGREIPKGADIFCTTDYGASEGIYLDVYLKWYEDGNPVTKGFITGKTLGESGDDLDNMFLISSAITKAFHGDGATHARYIRLGESQVPTSGVFHLSSEEQKTIIDALITQHEKYLGLIANTESLLRRMTGGITQYIDQMGRLPLQINDYDQITLTVRDGNLDAFKSLLTQVLEYAFLNRKPSSLLPPPCQVEAVVELDAVSFENLLQRPMDDQPQITAHKSLMRCEEGVEHCVLFLGEGSQDGVLVNSEGYDWARYAAFIPGARMIANSHLEQGISLRNLVTLGLPDHDVYLVHQTADVGFIPAADLAALTDQGKAQFAPLLDARVASIKQGAYGVEVALTGIEPELLTCYDQAVADSQRSTHALEYFM